VDPADIKKSGSTDGAMLETQFINKEFVISGTDGQYTVSWRHTMPFQAVPATVHRKMHSGQLRAAMVPRV
jgi:ribose 1,5-bisphosphokinase PhnN